MTPYINDADFTLYVGDVREQLRNLPAESVHCVVTSPPYWGLRDYGTGVWDGGDPDCDHARPVVNEDRRKREANNAVRDDDAGRYAQPSGWNGGGRESKVDVSVCKCGARRVDQQLGLEPTPDLYVQNMVDVFREVRRVLRRDGTCWLNIGDSYSSGNSGERTLGMNERLGRSPGQRKQGQNDQGRRPVPGMKSKDLVGIPWRLAFALQADGWYLRSDVIWSKPNPMPESVTDRPTKAHEYLFLLTQSPRYFYDADAIREPAEYGRRAWSNTEAVLAAATYAGDKRAEHGVRVKASVTGGDPSAGRNRRSVWEIPEEQPTLDPSLPPEKPRGPDGRRKTTVTGGEGSIQHRDGERWPADGANRRSVWNIATEPYPDAHFATFPQALVEPCVLAGTSERGCCPECGAPWERETEVSYYSSTYGDSRTPDVAGSNDQRGLRAQGGASFAGGERKRREAQTVGWCPTCRCTAEGTGVAGKPALTAASPPVPCVVLDPFMGSGTTALVARRLGRKAIGVELNEEYARLCAHRLRQLSLLA